MYVILIVFGIKEILLCIEYIMMSIFSIFSGNSADPNLMMVQYGSSENTNTYQSTSTAIYINKPSGGKFVMHYERVDASMAGNYKRPS